MTTKGFNVEDVVSLSDGGLNMAAAFVKNGLSGVTCPWFACGEEEEVWYSLNKEPDEQAKMDYAIDFFKSIAEARRDCGKADEGRTKAPG